MNPTAISLFPSKPVPNTVTCLTRAGSSPSMNFLTDGSMSLAWIDAPRNSMSTGSLTVAALTGSATQPDARATASATLFVLPVLDWYTTLTLMIPPLIMFASGSMGSPTAPRWQVLTVGPEYCLVPLKHHTGQFRNIFARRKSQERLGCA